MQMTPSTIFIDVETSPTDGKILDLGAVTENGGCFHASSIGKFAEFIRSADVLCGHNVIHHDLAHLAPILDLREETKVVDTLYLSPLLFPDRQDHSLAKDDKLRPDDLNNPVNDAKKARDLYYEEFHAFGELSESRQQIYRSLLASEPEFSGFFGCAFRDGTPMPPEDLPACILQEYAGLICENADLAALICEYPVELAYALAAIGQDHEKPCIAPWLIHNYPRITHVLKKLRGMPCHKGCSYCQQMFDIHHALEDMFGFTAFRSFDGKPLQEEAVQAAVDGDSLITVFPTGGGKSLTFQLPALMAGKSENALTVVISPLLSLMKDQVDSLAKRGHGNVVAINGLLNPVERAQALKGVSDGTVNLLYISPESLRSHTIHELLCARDIARFVIDEAHCFSAWGHDFRVDYLYIGDYIRELQEKKQCKVPIPVTCVTATAKKQVIEDLRRYFKDRTGLDMKLFAADSARKNLHYSVTPAPEDKKYQKLRSLIEATRCPTIVYVNSVRKTRELAQRLTEDGFRAHEFNGPMARAQKIQVQEAFMQDEIDIIVATSAFGMGVDKSNIGLVVHYAVSDSLENYMQESGRAGRDPQTQAECSVLLGEGDLDWLFERLNLTKLTKAEIGAVWTVIKHKTGRGRELCCSALELADAAGWRSGGGAANSEDDEKQETRVKAAIAALEQAGHIKRGYNTMSIYASSIQVDSMSEAAQRITESDLFDEEEQLHSRRIMSSLFTYKYAGNNASADSGSGEWRVEYLADMLSLRREQVIRCINLLRQANLLADDRDMCALVRAASEGRKSEETGTTRRSSNSRFRTAANLELFLIQAFTTNEADYSIKELNESAIDQGIRDATIPKIRQILNYLTLTGAIRKVEKQGNGLVAVKLCTDQSALVNHSSRRKRICECIIQEVYDRGDNRRKHGSISKTADLQVHFSLVELCRICNAQLGLQQDAAVTLADVEDALLFLSKTEAMRLEGGFLTGYNALHITRLQMNNRIGYTVRDYKVLEEYYTQKTAQIHIVGKYLELLQKDGKTASQFVHDYFDMDFNRFLGRYFNKQERDAMKRSITPEQYQKVFGSLSTRQQEIIQDDQSDCIVVAAGPGSGKTWVLVRKLASLLLMENVKPEQLLMLTFSRAAATEFKSRLIDLIGSTARYVEIRTFHSFAFDLLGRTGDPDKMDEVVNEAAQMIEDDEADEGRISKAVLVIDEAQDMSAAEYRLVQTLMARNEQMRVIAVGDDDQNIYAFRGSSSAYMKELAQGPKAKTYELTDNFRSCGTIVDFANSFVHTIGGRLKSADIQAVREDPGSVRVVRHMGCNLEQPIVDEITAARHDRTVCVLTATNQQAARVTGLLQREGIDAQLIQSVNRIQIDDIAELRGFVRDLRSASDASSIISEDAWLAAKNELLRKYSRSACLDTCMNMLTTFEKVNDRKYLQDFLEFMHESQFEDFYAEDHHKVTVSTIHRGKGREFDTVYMMLEDVKVRADEDRRNIYVGMTRAKSNLIVHTNQDIFPLGVPGVLYEQDTNMYPAPEELTLELSYKDVVLSFFGDKRALILKNLQSGDVLRYEEAGNQAYLTRNIRGEGCVRVAQLSRACRENLAKLRRDGYRVADASVRFVAAWMSKEDRRERNDVPESAVILPDLHLVR